MSAVTYEGLAAVVPCTACNKDHVELAVFRDAIGAYTHCPEARTPTRVPATPGLLADTQNRQDLWLLRNGESHDVPR